MTALREQAEEDKKAEVEGVVPIPTGVSVFCIYFESRGVSVCATLDSLALTIVLCIIEGFGRYYSGDCQKR